MYNIPHFKASDDAEVLAFLHAYPFATLIAVDAQNKPVATQVPVFVDQKESKLFISGHIMRKTDHHLALMHQPKALIVFNGLHTYVSASWYSNPHGASTWNYTSVHASGMVRFMNDEELEALLIRTTHFYEKDPASPAGVKHFPEGYLQQHMKAIIGFEMEVASLDHVFKLSQNKDEQTYDRIVNELSKQGPAAVAVAEQMRNRKHKVFNA